MQKGKFGFSLWLYPFIALWTVLVGPALASILILGFVVAAEKDEWAIKQCIHVVMFTIYWNVYKAVMGFLTGIPLLGIVMSVVDGIVFVVMLVLILVLGLGRLKKGMDIGLPGKGIVNYAYGFVQQAVPMAQQYVQPPYQQAQPQPQQPPYQQATQGYAQPPVYPQQSAYPQTQAAQAPVPPAPVAPAAFDWQAAPGGQNPPPPPPAF